MDEAIISAYSRRNRPYTVHKTAPEHLRLMVTLDKFSVFPNSCGSEANVEHIAATIEIIIIINPELSFFFSVYSLFI